MLNPKIIYFMNNILEDIGSKVRKLREFKDISQDYMAEQLGISQSHYSRIENGERKLDSEPTRKNCPTFRNHRRRYQSL